MFYARRRVRAALDEANARDVVVGPAAPSADLSKLAADGRLSAPVVHDDAPFPDADTNPATAPIHTFHLGLWFGSPAAAVSAGCPNTMTPFNGDHKAGIQVLSTRNFPAGNGPLRHLVP